MPVESTTGGAAVWTSSNKIRHSFWVPNWPRRLAVLWQRSKVPLVAAAAAVAFLAGWSCRLSYHDIVAALVVVAARVPHLPVAWLVAVVAFPKGTTKQQYFGRRVLVRLLRLPSFCYTEGDNLSETRSLVHSGGTNELGVPVRPVKQKGKEHDNRNFLDFFAPTHGRSAVWRNLEYCTVDCKALRTMVAGTSTSRIKLY